MAEMSNGDLVRSTYDAFTNRDFESAVACVAEDLEWTEVASGRRYSGPEGMLREYRERMLREYREWARAFPDSAAVATSTSTR